MKKTFYRSYENRTFGGVAAGLAKYLDVDVSILRALFVILAVLGGSGLIIYFILLVLTPMEPDSYQGMDRTTENVNAEKPSAKTKTEEVKIEQKRLVGIGAWIFGLSLIFVGLLFFCSSFGIIHFSLFSLMASLLRLWPFIFIFVGLSLIPMKQILKKILLILAFLAFLGLFFFQTGNHLFCTNNNSKIFSNTCTKNSSCNYFNASTPIGDFCEIEVKKKGNNLRELTVNIGASSFSGMNVCTHDEIQIRENNGLKIKENYSDDERHIKVTNNQSNLRSADIHCDLNPDFTWNIEINAGAGDINLDLSEYKIKSIEISTGASNVQLILGNKYPETKVEVAAGAANIEISTKKGAGVRLKNNTILSNNNFNNMLLKNGYYYTPNYESSQNKIYITSEGAISSFSLHIEE